MKRLLLLLIQLPVLASATFVQNEAFGLTYSGFDGTFHKIQIQNKQNCSAVVDVDFRSSGLADTVFLLPANETASFLLPMDQQLPAHSIRIRAEEVCIVNKSLEWLSVKPNTLQPLPIETEWFQVIKWKDRVEISFRSTMDEGEWIDIQRSQNGKDWTTINKTKIFAGVNKHVDQQFQTGVNFYRLKMVEQGQSKYSNTIQVFAENKQGPLTVYNMNLNPLFRIDSGNMILVKEALKARPKAIYLIEQSGSFEKYMN